MSKYLNFQATHIATCFQNVLETIESHHMESLLALTTPFNFELVKQFYSTLYISGKRDDITTWVLEWMIQGEPFRMGAAEFMDLINLPRYEEATEKIHLLPAVTNAEFSTLLDPEVVGDAMPTIIKPKHFVFISQTWFHILTKTLLPLEDAHDNSRIPRLLRHAVLKLSHGQVFDFEDCFLRVLVESAENPIAIKSYAPWLYPVCNFLKPESYIARRWPLLYTPPARHTKVLAFKSNNPCVDYVGLRQHISERNLDPKFNKPCYHYETSLRTQQMLQEFIDANQL